MFWLRWMREVTRKEMYEGIHKRQLRVVLVKEKGVKIVWQ